jgi:hypothetical protein
MTFSQIRFATISFVAVVLVAGTTLAIAARSSQDDARKVADTPPALPDRKTVQTALKAWWDGIETLEFRDVCYDVKDDERPNLRGRHLFVGFAMGAGNRRAVMHGTIEPDRQIAFVQERRDNGRIQCYLGSDGTVPAKVTKVTKKLQTNTRTSYHDEMGTVLWLITPWSKKQFDARPLFLHLEEGAPLEIDRGPDGKPRVRISLEYGSQRYELDPEHDFLPKRVSGELFDILITRFARNHGHWFPVEGLVKHKVEPDQKGKTDRFRVTDLEINQPIPDERFEVPSGLEMVPVLDLTGGKEGPAGVKR